MSIPENDHELARAIEVLTPAAAALCYYVQGAFGDDTHPHNLAIDFYARLRGDREGFSTAQDAWGMLFYIQDVLAMWRVNGGEVDRSKGSEAD